MKQRAIHELEAIESSVSTTPPEISGARVRMVIHDYGIESGLSKADKALLNTINSTRKARESIRKVRDILNTG